MAKAQPRRQHEPLEMLRLQLTARAVHDEALMRYVSNPENLDEIGRLLGECYDKLVTLPSPGFCPVGWVHEMCRCRPADIGPKPPNPEASR